MKPKINNLTFRWILLNNYKSHTIAQQGINLEIIFEEFHKHHRKGFSSGILPLRYLKNHRTAEALPIDNKKVASMIT